jgi:hypothetical protein
MYVIACRDRNRRELNCLDSQCIRGSTVAKVDNASPTDKLLVVRLAIMCFSFRIMQSV